MHRGVSSRWLRSSLNFSERPKSFDLPLFLCPALRRTVASQARTRPLLVPSRRLPSPWLSSTRCYLHTQEQPHNHEGSPLVATEVREILERLPQQCTGCGALSQVTNPNLPGYFDLDRKTVRQYVGLDELKTTSKLEDQVFEDAIKRATGQGLEEQGVDLKALAMAEAVTKDRQDLTASQRARLNTPPLCHRCHNLVHHDKGMAIYHPTVQSIRDTLMESPYKYNHVYHILDAADLPMSLLPKIHSFLDAMPLRTKNRRAKNGRFYHDQRTEMSFVVTRSDLLAPTKEQVDRIMPWVQDVIRDALGRTGRNLRLGNVHCVSAQRSWWTKQLKEDIYKRGGACWMVGKVNVGKSQLFESVFPKGRMNWDPSHHQINVDIFTKTDEREYQKTLERKARHNDRLYKMEKGQDLANETSAEAFSSLEEASLADKTGREESMADWGEEFEPEDDDENFSLLPPALKEEQYPEMPVVSSVPGTTCSPIRIPFGNGRGELIDLPGIERSGLEHYVQEEHRRALLMRKRITANQMTIKPGQSLILGGGLIRITPRDPSTVILACSFLDVNLPHVTSTEKAIALQSQADDRVLVESIATEEAAAVTKLAGSFQLKWDITKARAGPLTAKDAQRLKIHQLPFRVMATDILIEGVGWVELVAQVRTRDLEKPLSAETEGSASADMLTAMEQLEAAAGGTTPKPKPFSAFIPGLPIVDVYSPEGQFIASRRTLNGGMLNAQKNNKTGARPRRSMKGVKKNLKKLARQAQQSSRRN